MPQTRFPLDWPLGSDEHPPPVRGGGCYWHGCFCHFPWLEKPARHHRDLDGAKIIRLIPFLLAAMAEGPAGGLLPALLLAR